MQASLVMVKADGTTREIQVDREQVLIGRDEGCRVRVPLPSVSRKHCEIKVDDGELVVNDLGSSNGTYVNGKRVKKTELAPGDLLCVGPVVFVVRIDGHPKNIDAKDSFAAGAVTDDNDDSGELPNPTSTTVYTGSGKPPTSGQPPTKGKGPAVGKSILDDSGDDDLAALLKDLELDDDDDDPKPKKK